MGRGQGNDATLFYINRKGGLLKKEDEERNHLVHFKGSQSQFRKDAATNEQNTQDPTN